MAWFVKQTAFGVLVISILCIINLRQASAQTAPGTTDLQDGIFNDRKPPPDPTNQAFKDYVGVLTRFDDWATGHTHVRGPEDVLPDDQFNDRKPPDQKNNKAFQNYFDVLTRFDTWVTGNKVPIPKDAATDAQHQDVGADGDQVLQSLGGEASEPQSAAAVSQDTGFPDYAPPGPKSQAFKDYAGVLTRFDTWVTGKKVPIPRDEATDALHQIFRRSVISSDQQFADQFSDLTPANPTGNPSYNQFVKELKRYDPWITGQKVAIPNDPATDALH